MARTDPEKRRSGLSKTTDFGLLVEALLDRDRDAGRDSYRNVLKNACPLRRLFIDLAP